MAWLLLLLRCEIGTMLFNSCWITTDRLNHMWLCLGVAKWCPVIKQLNGLSYSYSKCKAFDRLWYIWIVVQCGHYFHIALLLGVATFPTVVRVILSLVGALHCWYYLIAHNYHLVTVRHERKIHHFNWDLLCCCSMLFVRSLVEDIWPSPKKEEYCTCWVKVTVYNQLRSKGNVGMRHVGLY